MLAFLHHAHCLSFTGQNIPNMVGLQLNIGFIFIRVELDGKSDGDSPEAQKHLLGQIFHGNVKIHIFHC